VFVCVLYAFILCLPRVEAGKNTSIVIPASRKRRQKGNPVVSGETVPAFYPQNIFVFHMILTINSGSRKREVVRDDVKGAQ
jgi:hypothetical protein